MYVGAPSDVTIPTSKNCSPSSSESHVIGKKLVSIFRISLRMVTSRFSASAVKCCFLLSKERQLHHSKPRAERAGPGDIVHGSLVHLTFYSTKFNTRTDESRALSQNEHQALHHSYADSAHPGTKTNVMSTHTERCLAASLVKVRKKQCQFFFDAL